jgi:hypothetical protein
MIPTFTSIHRQENTMRTSDQKPDPGVKGPGMLHEADVGSGERTPAQHETDKMISEIPPRGSQQQPGQAGGQQSGQGDAAKP